MIDHHTPYNNLQATVDTTTVPFSGEQILSFVRLKDFGLLDRGLQWTYSYIS